MFAEPHGFPVVGIAVFARCTASSALLGRAQPVIPTNLYSSSLFINIIAWGPQVSSAVRGHCGAGSGRFAMLR